MDHGGAWKLPSSPRWNGNGSTNRQLLESIGNIPPARAAERYYAMLDEQKLAE